MNRRAKQLASTLRREVQGVLARGIRDPRVKGMITVTEVSVDDDATHAVVRISVMPHKHESSSLHGLKSASGWIRRQVGDRIEIRRMPTLEFELDRSMSRQAEVIEALARVQGERVVEEWGVDIEIEEPEQP